ncbi:MAG TPA: HNH endonuclease [Candidatus Angelobacter sp.]|jgi:hypothetical protein|nr:HNH endonuclease [Candidatus Angelobacter sp.]
MKLRSVHNGMKRCAKCFVTKPVAEFYGKKGGTFEAYCKPCKKVMKHSLPRSDTLAERFWPKVNKAGPNGCWEWTGGKDSYGYGYIFTGGTPYQERAHRVSLRLHGVDLPAGDRRHERPSVDHLCNNRACVNPAHLDVTTHAENIRRIARRRADAGHK